MPERQPHQIAPGRPERRPHEIVPPGAGRPSYVARFVAVLALLATFVLVTVAIVTSGGDSDDDRGRAGKGTKADGEVERALDRGVYIVKPGDTLVAIEEKTDIPVDELEDLNPTLDTQILVPGQRIKLR
jgi:hypothetical protein